MKKYFPILLSKAGELKALKELSQPVKDEICPTIQILPDDLQTVEAHLIQEWNFKDNEIIIDLSLFQFHARNVRFFFTSLFKNGVNAIPAIQQNSDPNLIALVNNLITTNGCKVCVRTSNDTGGFTNFNANVNTLIGRVGATPTTTLLLLDLGYAQSHNYNNLAALAISTITAIPNKSQWSSLIVAAGSFPENLSALSPAGHIYRLQRYEWDIWNTIQSNRAIAGIVKYGDFGTKYPYFVDANFQGSCSIKYTVRNEFVIYRGELSGNHRDGNGQYITFAGRLTSSPDYSGITFSWGDAETHRIGSYLLTDPKKKTGNAGTWVQLSQNHHITFLHSIL